MADSRLTLFQPRKTSASEKYGPPGERNKEMPPNEGPSWAPRKTWVAPIKVHRFAARLLCWRTPGESEQVRANHWSWRPEARGQHARARFGGLLPIPRAARPATGGGRHRGRPAFEGKTASTLAVQG